MTETNNENGLPREWVGRNAKTLAHSFHDTKAEADEFLKNLKRPFAFVLDEIAEQAMVPLKRRSSTLEYVGGSLDLDGIGVTLHFTPETFLCLSLFVDLRHAERIGKETFEKFTTDRGYSMVAGVLAKSVQLSEANSPEEAIQQVRQGAAFLRDEVGGWEHLLKGTAQ